MKRENKQLKKRKKKNRKKINKYTSKQSQYIKHELTNKKRVKKHKLWQSCSFYECSTLRFH